MQLSIINKVMKLPLWGHALGAAVSFAAFNWVKGKLDASYVASNHPVDYVTGQTSFNGDTIKGYYNHMIDAGTLDVYWQTQLIDYGFIAAMLCIGLFAGTLIARIGRAESWSRKIGKWAAVSIMLGAVSDAIENLISFIMLSNPQDFANWIAIPYSAFATIKFFLIALGMVGLIVTLVLAAVGRLMRKPKLG